MKSKMKAIILAGMLTCIASVNAQENVGIGTLTPNPKAILDLSSTEKGILIPRMDSVQRIAISPDSLGDAGLLVYDLSDSLFYFWNTHRWHPYPSPLSDGDWKIVGNDMYGEVPGNVGVGTTNPVAKFHTVGTLRFAGLSSATNNDVLVINSSGDVRYRTLGSDIWDGDAVNDADSNPLNECNTGMFFNSSNNTLTLVDACGAISETIAISSTDGDADSTNEIQGLFSSTTPGNVVTINITKGGTSTSFNNNDADANPSNELQTLSILAVGDSITWSLNQSGGSGSFSIDDHDWAGIGTGSLYPSSLTDNVGIGTSTPAYRLDVNGNMRASSKIYFNTTDYYIERNLLDLSFYSDNDMKFATNNGHVIRFYESGSEAVVNFNQDGQDVLTLRGIGAYSYGVGIGTTTPTNKLQVAGDVRVGLINPSGFTNGGNNYGNLIYFSGGPGNTANSDNNDLLFIGRYNTGPNVSELRVGVGDDYNSATDADRFSIGSYSGGNIANFEGLFDFEIKNPALLPIAPMLSISPFGTTHNKDYHGGLAITKPSTSGQYINLARGASTVWSLGYQYNTPHFAISEGNTSDASFATTAPFFTILNASGNVGIGVANPTQKFQVSGNGLFSGTVTASCGVLVCSDIRFKKDIQPITHSLDKIKMVNGVRYNWRSSEFPERNFSDKEQIGFIAQDIEAIIPEMVNTDEAGYKTVDYAKITPVIVEAMKEQQELLEAEKTAHEQTIKELNELKFEVQSLKNQFKTLEAELNKGGLTTSELR